MTERDTRSLFDGTFSAVCWSNTAPSFPSEWAVSLFCPFAPSGRIRSLPPLQVRTSPVAEGRSCPEVPTVGPNGPKASFSLYRSVRERKKKKKKIDDKRRSQIPLDKSRRTEVVRADVHRPKLKGSPPNQKRSGTGGAQSSESVFFTNEERLKVAAGGVEIGATCRTTGLDLRRKRRFVKRL